MSDGPLDCNGNPLTIGDVCRIVSAPPEFQTYLGTIVTVTDMMAPGTQMVRQDIGPLTVFGMPTCWTVVVEGSGLPPTPDGEPWLFDGDNLQKLFGPSVDIDEDTDKEKEKDDALTA